MRVNIHDDKQSLGRAAAEEGAETICTAIASRGSAAIILATGASQFEMLQVLIDQDVDWERVTVFHLDEYVGLDIKHPASFRGYLRKRFVECVDGLNEFVEVNGNAQDLQSELDRLAQKISSHNIDVCFAGIGENCHLAFNDPPADFNTKLPYIVVELDEACRRQQHGEGWFSDLDAVPTHAISMSIRQMMSVHKLVLAVPDGRKAKAVQHALEGEVTNRFPASILQNHDNVSLHLDRDSASLLERVPCD